MKRRRFLTVCGTVAGTAALPGSVGAVALSAHAELFPSQGAQQLPRIKVFGACGDKLELHDYSRRYAPDGASRSVENIFYNDFFPGGLMSSAQSDAGERQWANADGELVDFAPFVPEMLRRIGSYANDADILIGIADLGERDGLIGPLMEAVAQAAPSPGTMKIALAILPFSFKGESYRVRARAELEMLKAKYDAVSVIPSDRVLEGKDSMILEDAERAVDSLTHLATEALVATVLR